MPTQRSTVVGMDGIQPAVVEQFLNRQTRKRHAGAIQEVERRVWSHRPHHGGCLLHDEPKALFTFPQLALGAAASAAAAAWLRHHRGERVRGVDQRVRLRRAQVRDQAVDAPEPPGADRARERRGRPCPSGQRGGHLDERIGGEPAGQVGRLGRAGEQQHPRAVGAQGARRLSR